MCRILLLVSSPESLSTAAKIMEVFVKASSSDELLKRLVRDARHCHGYGALVALRRGASWQLIYERYDSYPHPGGDEESCRENLEELSKFISRLSRLSAGSQGVLALLHSRRTRGEPRGALQVHPYSYTIAARSGPKEVYLAHNGSVDKEPLAALVGVDPAAYTDSYVLAVWLARQLSYGRTLVEAVQEVKHYVKTALNLGLVVLGSQHLEAYGVGYVKEGLSREAREYYELYCFEGRGIAGVASSTIKTLSESEGLDLEFKSCDGVVVRVDIEKPGLEVLARIR